MIWKIARKEKTLPREVLSGKNLGKDELHQYEFKLNKLPSTKY